MPPEATVGGVCVVEITVDVADPHRSMFPAPVVPESQIAQPTIVLEPAVHAGNVIVPLLLVDDAAPAPPELALFHAAAFNDCRAYPV
jgi:hypothetical protein